MVAMRVLCLSLLMTAVGVAVAQGLAGPPPGEVVALYPNQDFENEKLDWGFWPSESRTRMELDREVVQHGRQSLRMTAVDAGDRGFALAGIGKFDPGIYYRITVHFKRDASVPDSALSFFLNFREGPDKPIKSRVYPAAVQRRPVGDWEAWSGYVSAPPGAPEAQFLLGVEHTVGRVWWDNIIIERLGPIGELITDMWTNLTVGVEIGSPPLQRFSKHRTANTPLFQMATRFNNLLWRSAYQERDLRDLERAAHYAERILPVTLRRCFDVTEQTIYTVYLTFGDALRAKATAVTPAFAAAADMAEQALQTFQSDLDRQATDLRPKAPVSLPAHLGTQERTVRPIEPTGRMNRLLFGVWSPLEFSAWEQERLNAEFHSAAPGAPKVHTESETDFSNITDTCNDLQARGYAGTFGYLSFGVHQYLYAPQWLMDKHQAEPDFVKVSWDGLKGEANGSSRCLNYFHPAVRQYIKDYLGKYARFCHGEPRVLFHEVAQEAYPGFTVGGGLRLVSYGPHMVAAFRDYLRGKYGTIAALNREWGTSYADFGAVEPPPDPYAKKWDTPSPLTCEFANFDEQAYLDYLKLIYDSLKAGDPDKPVVARHSGLLSRINGARVFETCDVLSAHTRAPLMNVMNFYLTSLNRYHHQGLGYMEDFWGVQEEAGRVSEERAQRRGLEKHVAREGLWGRTLQMKWYSYTTGSYVFTYNGNWLNVGKDLLLWRYCAPGLAVAKQKLESVDWMLTHSEIVPARLLIVQPSASMRNERPASPPYGEIMALHGLLAPGGLLYELVPEEYVADGRCRLSEFKVVVLPQAKYLSAALQEQVAQFVAQGGTLFALGQPGVLDELARPSEALTRRLAAMAGARWAEAERAWQPPAAGAAPPPSPLADLPCGKGRLLAAANLGRFPTREQRTALLETLTAAAPRQAYAENSRLEVLLRVAEDGERYLCLLNPDVDNPVTETVCVEAPVLVAIDVLLKDGYRVPCHGNAMRSRLSVRLGPGEMTVISLGRPTTPKET